MVGAQVSKPMSPTEFESQIRNKRIKSKTKVHLQSMDQWLDASSVPLFNDIKARIKLEAEELTAQKYAEKRAREEQAKQQKSTKAEMNRRAKAMKSANSLGGERPVKGSGIRARFCEWILVQAESLIFILFWFGLLVTLVLGFVYTIGYVAMSGSAAFGLAVGILGTLISVALYVVLFVCSAAPIIALLRIAENTRVMAEQSCYG